LYGLLIELNYIIIFFNCQEGLGRIWRKKVKTSIYRAYIRPEMNKFLRKSNTLNLLLIYLQLLINHTKPIKIEKKRF